MSQAHNTPTDGDGSEPNDYTQELVCWGLNHYRGTELDPTNIDEWEWPDRGVHDCGDFEPARASVKGHIGSVSIDTDRNTFEDIAGEVFFSERGVRVATEPKAEGIRMSMCMTLGPHEAMQLAAAIFAAAWECRAWRQSIDDPPDIEED